MTVGNLPSISGRKCGARLRPFARAPLHVVLSAFAATGLLVSGASAMDVHEFEPKLAQYVGQQAKIEGRFRSAGAGKLFLVDSEIEFQLGRFAGQVRRSMQGIAVEGQLIRGGDKPLFRVDSFRALPADTERFRELRGRITPGNHRSLFDLASWARRQSRWYHDRPLAQLAADAYREAFDWATEEAVRLNDVRRILFLSACGEGIGLPPAVAEELRHRACLILVGRTTEVDAAERLAVAARVRALLGGTTQPLAEDRAAWAAQYLADPQATYSQLTAAERREAARALWAKLVAGALERQGTNLSGEELEELVARAAREIPDRGDTIRRLRRLAVQQRAAAASSLSRAEVLRLRDELTELEEPAMARAVIESWLKSRRIGLDPQDAEGRLLLASEFRNLLADQQAAAALLIEALKIAPNLSEARELLAELGYVYRDGAWLPVRAGDSTAESPAANDASKPLAAGASEQTVIARLRRPDRVARIGTQNAITEQWIYEGPPRLYIYLQRSTVTGQARVTRIEGGP